MAKVVAVVNQKGGVGKTTVACHQVFAVAEKKQTVLLVDFDTQGNASQILSRNPVINKQPGGAELLFSDGELKFSDGTDEHIKILHGHSRLEVLDRDPNILKTAVAMRAKIRNLPFDYVIFDTPPSIGPRQVAPLFWADLVVIPVEPASLSMSGLKDVLETIQGASRVNPGIAVRLVVNRYVKSSSEQTRMRGELEQKLGRQIIAELPQRVHVSDALSRGLPVWRHSSDKGLKVTWTNFTAQLIDLIA